MRYLVLLIGIFYAFTGLLHAQEIKTSVIHGQITHEQNPIPAVNIGLEQINIGTSTDSNGTFSLDNIPASKYTLKATAVGYKSVRQTISLEAGDTVEVHIKMQRSIHQLGEMVVTGNMEETHVKESPVKVQVVTDRYLNKNPSNNLMGSINYINGVQQQINCGVCGTSSIRINGMKGPYTAVLIDGMPIMGSLASVYGLDGISSNLINRIEVIKGPNSTLYGSEAMGGVINIITNNPDKAELISLHGYRTTHGANNMDISVAPDLGETEVLFSGNLYYFDRFLDHNKDNFSDVPLQHRVSLFNKWQFDRPGRRNFNIAAKGYFENRIAGVSSYTEAYEGSDRIYGESIDTRRLELLGNYPFFIAEQPFRIDFSLSHHHQDSYYGDYHYIATQQTRFLNFIWNQRATADQDMLLGLTFRQNLLDQQFDKINIPNGSHRNRITPGIFGQYEHALTQDLKGLAGMRIDYHEEHGLIYSPRISFKARNDRLTTIRLNAGTGFRVVNLFTEEHEALTGSRRVVIEEELKPERSSNLTMNVNQILRLGGGSVLNLDLDLFYSYFSNQIIPGYANADQIRYHNLNGHSVSRGIGLSAAHNFPGPMEYSIGFTYKDVYKQTKGEKRDLVYAPSFSGVFTFTYELESIRTRIDYTGRVTGPMALPEYPGHDDQSEWFTVQNLKLSRPLIDRFKIYVSVKNIFNYTQPHPIIAPDRPFSEDFATDHVYGPTQTRRFMLGLRYNLN